MGSQISRSYVLSGVFLSGTERQQTERVSMENRIENQIFVKLGETNALPEIKPKQIVCYLNRPEEITSNLISFEKAIGERVHCYS